jgi:hypothetical protein
MSSVKVGVMHVLQDISGLKIIVRLTTIVYFSIEMTKVCVARKACVMHVVESVTGDKPKAF